MSTDSDSRVIATPMMSAEAGYEGDETQAPLRISGFLSLLFGLASVLSFIAVPVLILPAIAIFFGLFALRRYDGKTPVGTTAARFGLLFAVGFGAAGLGIPLMKRHTLGSQAEYFARQFIELTAKGEMQYAKELTKEPRNRFLSTMSLAEHYASVEGAQEALEEFQQDAVYESFKRIGPGAKWELEAATRVYHQFHFDHAEVMLVNYDLEKPCIVQFILECHPSEKTGELQWRVELCQHYRKRLVAESIL